MFKIVLVGGRTSNQCLRHMPTLDVLPNHSTTENTSLPVYHRPDRDKQCRVYILIILYKPAHVVDMRSFTVFCVFIVLSSFMLPAVITSCVSPVCDQTTCVSFLRVLDLIFPSKVIYILMNGSEHGWMNMMWKVDDCSAGPGGCI